MKTRIIFFTISLLMLAIIPSQAQLRFGLKLGANISHASFKDFDTDNVSSFTGGPMVEFMFPIFGLGIDAAAMYAGKGYKSIDDSRTNSTLSKETTRFHYIDIPVNLKWKFGLPMLKVFLAAGPDFGFMINNNLKNVNADRERKFDLGINLGGGVEVFHKLQVGVQYGWGLTNAVNLEGHGNGKNRNIQITAAYLF